MCVAEWLLRETQNLLIAVGRRSNSRSSRFFLLIRGLVLFFLHFLELLFVVFSLVFAKRILASVLILV